MVLSVNRPFIEAPGFERPDYTIFTAPAANLADAGAEEIEIDQALSLTGRRGRDYLGMAVEGIMNEIGLEFAGGLAANIQLALSVNLQSRTGSFGIDDPETIDRINAVSALTYAEATETGGVPMNVFSDSMILTEPELYVAPRLFFDMTNNLDRQVDADDMSVRISSVSRRLSFRLFIELLERFADVTLL